MSPAQLQCLQCSRSLIKNLLEFYNLGAQPAVKLGTSPGSEQDVVPHAAGDGGGWAEGHKCGASFLINSQGQIQPSS